MNLSAIDLNLLVALDALLRERSVTRAARRVGLSQPAMSHALSRLRELLQDPLLFRVGKSMALTERAEALAGPTGAALRGLEALLAAPERFDPGRSTRQFHIATTDYAQFLLLGPLSAILAREAPSVDLRVQPISGRSIDEALLRGDVDLALGRFGAELTGPHLHRQDLFEERFVGVARADHPALRGPIDVATFVALSHVLVSPRGSGGGVVDTALAALGTSRRVAMVVPHFLVVPHLIAASDHVSSLLERAALRFAEMLPIRLFDLPIELPRISIAMLWHERRHHVEDQRWLRRTVQRALEEVSPGRETSLLPTFAATPSPDQSRHVVKAASAPHSTRRTAARRPSGP